MVVSKIFSRLPGFSRPLSYVLNDSLCSKKFVHESLAKSFGSLSITREGSPRTFPQLHLGCAKPNQLLMNVPVPGINILMIRGIVKVSMRSGKRKGSHAVPARFFRLGWGAWIRTVAGRHKKLWKKNCKRRRRYAHHLICNETYSRKLDAMVSKYYRRRRYFIEDIYEPYHDRENFGLTKKNHGGGNFWLNRALEKQYPTV
ncbi:large ribosomal subunit protein bL35m-like [Artemia franciscana]